MSDAATMNAETADPSAAPAEGVTDEMLMGELDAAFSDEPEEEAPAAQQPEAEPEKPEAEAKEEALAEPEAEPSDDDVADDEYAFLNEEPAKDAAAKDDAESEAKHAQVQESATITHWQAKAQMAEAETGKLAEQVQQLQGYIAQMSGPQEPNPDLLSPDSEGYDPDTYHREMATFRKHSMAQEQARQAAQEQQQREVGTFLAKQRDELKEHLPALFDPKIGPKLKSAMKAMAIDAGVTEDQFAMLPAKQAVIIDKALKWDNAMAQRKSAKTASKASPTVRQSRREAPTPETTVLQNFDPSDDASMLNVFEAIEAA